MQCAGSLGAEVARYQIMNGIKVAKFYRIQGFLIVLEKTIQFQTFDLTKFCMSSEDLNIGIISGTTHIKMIVIFSPAIGKHFIANALCRCDDSVMWLIHICTSSHCMMSFTTTSLQKKNPEESNLQNEGTREWFPPSFCLTIRKLPAQKGMNMMEEVKWCTI
jgi:hypothetical protein